MFQLNSPLRMSSLVKGYFCQIWQCISLWQWSAITEHYHQADKILHLKVKWDSMTLPGKVLLPWSGVYISNVHYDHMSQLRTTVLSICVKCSMTCIITIIGGSLVVARHREFFFVDYQDGNGHSIMNLSNMWLLKPLTRNTTCFLARLIITKYDLNTKSLIPWARRKV